MSKFLMAFLCVLVGAVSWPGAGRADASAKTASAATAITTATISGNTSGTTGPAIPHVPTTHMLAIGTILPGVAPADVLAILPEEVRQTVDLYLGGKIENWYSLQDRMGVVFVLNVTDRGAAQAMLEALPLGQAHMMSFELLPLGPLNPLRWLEGMAGGIAPQ